MSFGLLSILIITATGVLFWTKRRRWVVWLLGLAALLILLVGSGPLTQLALDGLQNHPRIMTPEWSSRNAIVVLGVGSVQWPQPGVVTSHTLGYSRLHEAARLYFDCKKRGHECRLLTTGGDPSRNGTSEAEIMAKELADLGVTEGDLIVESKSNNTFQNAQFSSAILSAEGFDRVFLVTSGVHMNRALVYFSHFMKAPIPAPSEQLAAIHSIFPIAYNFTLMDVALHEYTGLWRYRLYNFMGWNPSPRVSEADGQCQQRFRLS